VEERRRQERELAVRLARIALALGLGALALALFSPFFSIIAWAAILSYALSPLHRHLVRATGERRTLSALLMCLLLTIGLILPLVSLSFLIGEELTRTYTAIGGLAERAAKGESLLPDQWRQYPMIAAAIERLDEYERLTGKNVRAGLIENLADPGKLLLGELTSLATNVLVGVIELLFIPLCCFFFFRDGDRLAAWLRDVLPFSRERQRQATQRFDEIVTGSIYGNAVVALVVGSVGGLAFFAVGFHSPFLWGAAMGMLVYLPIPGVSLVWVPGAFYLFFQSAYLKTAVLCTAGVVILFLDHVVRNLLVAGRVKLHPLLVIFSVLGGLKLFGLLGLVAGPLTVAMSMALLDVYRIGRAESSGKEGGAQGETGA